MSIIKTENTSESFNALLACGDIETCPVCGAYNAYAWQDTNMDVNSGLRMKPEDGLKDGNEFYTEEELLTNWPDVYQIPIAFGSGWECRKCGNSFVLADSSYAQNCYTHCDE
jgi:hypothetical protein